MIPTFCDDENLWKGSILTMGLKRQHAVLPYIQIGDELQVMVMTSRESKRWVIPKGWPEKGRSASEQAAIEAYEEAGLLGTVSDEPIGDFHYVKGMKAGKEKLCNVSVYPMLIETQLLDWPEKGQRDYKWVSPQIAAGLVNEQELSWLIKSFTPTNKSASNAVSSSGGERGWFKRILSGFGFAS